jgi:hypothetical protein
LPKDEPTVTVKNNLGTVSWQCIEVTPNTLDELLQIMVKAKRENLTVKAAGAFRAISSVRFSVHTYNVGIAEHGNLTLAPPARRPDI